MENFNIVENVRKNNCNNNSASILPRNLFSRWKTIERNPVASCATLSNFRDQPPTTVSFRSGSRGTSFSCRSRFPIRGEWIGRAENKRLPRSSPRLVVAPPFPPIAAGGETSERVEEEKARRLNGKFRKHEEGGGCSTPSRMRGF